LHRWVLLKNSIIRAIPTSSATPSDHPDSAPNTLDDRDDAEEEVFTDEEVDSFMFPDVGKFVEGPTVEVNNSEAQWLDSLLETLGDDEEDDFGVDSDSHNMSVDDDDDQLFSPLPSPMSSSDDLTIQTYYPSLVQYPVPYPPFRPSLVHSYPFDSTFDSPLTSILPPYDDPLPYYDQDDVEELSVPDAIEDTSDDESEALTTPSLGRSSSSISLVDPASIPLPVERSRLGHPHIYIIDSDDSFFYPFDPLPFPNDRLTSYATYQEC